MSDTSAVSLKLPTFWSNQAEVWFAQAESQFAIREIKKELTKYHYVVSALDQETAVRVLDIIQKVPADNPYTTLKNRLVGTFTLSEYERANKLLNLPALGDQKPSCLMDQMLGLLGEHQNSCFLFCQLFLNKLPERIRSVLIHSKIQDCRELATSADRLYESYNTSEGSAGINKVSTQRNKNNNRGRQRDRKDKPTRNGMCFYHSRFSDKAHRCESPCNWSSENESAGSQ